MELDRLARPRMNRLLRSATAVMLIGSVAADMFVMHVPHFAVEASFAFSAWYGALACAILIVVARGVGMLLGRPDGYYGATDD